MSLAFLAKKGWHTATLRNQEKVWIAEKAHDEEQQRIKDLQKQVEEERQMRELQELQGRVREQKGEDRVDWMYEGPMQARADAEEKEAEEFLLGKTFKGKQAGVDEIKAAESKYGPGGASGSGAVLPAPASANELFRRLHEDPLLRMKQAEKQAKDAVVANPIKMGKIRADVERAALEKKAAKAAKREAKKAKKAAKKAAKKSRKHKSRRRSRSSSSSSSSSGDEASVKPSTGGLERQLPSHSNSAGASTGQAEQHAIAAKLALQGSQAANGSNTAGHKRGRSPSPRQHHSSDSKRQRSRRSRSPAQQHRPSSSNGATSAAEPAAAHRDDAQRHNTAHAQQDHRDHQPQQQSSKQQQRYGLQSGPLPSDAPVHIGPRADILEARRAADAVREKERALQRKRHSGRMSQEEKLARAADMEADAGVHVREQRRRTDEERHRKRSAAESAAAEALAAGAQKGSLSAGKEAAFLKEMGAAAVEGMSMGERMSRNKHWQQRDAGVENFLHRDK